LRKLNLIASGILAAVWLPGCSLGFHWDERIDGPYFLVAVDALEEMSVSYREPPNTSGSAFGLIEETVFAVGWNADYIVAKRHPENNRRVTEYYYIVRKDAESAVYPGDGVRGPFNEEAYQREAERLGLPPFTREFKKLK